MPKPNDADHQRRSHIKITKRSVESIEPRETGALIRYDEKLAGFGVRVMPSGRRFYFARYRNKHGRSRWFTIGEHGKVTPEAARRTAQRILQTVAVDGRDPSGEREAFRAAPTVNDLLIAMCATCTLFIAPRMQGRRWRYQPKWLVQGICDGGLAFARVAFSEVA